MFKCCFSNKVVNTTGEINKKNSKEFTKSINKNIKKMRKSNFNEKDYNPKYLGDGLSKTYKININDIDLTCKKIKKIKEEEDIMKNEIKLLKLLSYEIHFPIFYNAIESKQHIFLLYRYIEGIDLFEIMKHPTFSLNTKESISTIIFEIVLGLEYLFSYNYIHLDIKPENIIIKKEKPIRIKIIDLAFCKKLNNSDNKLDAIYGTIGYCSPEVILQKRYSHNSDIWSLGIILYILFKDHYLFGNTKKTYINDLKNFENIKKFRKIYLEGIDKEALELINNMLVKDPTDRYSLRDVKNHEFIQTNKESNINK